MNWNIPVGGLFIYKRFNPDDDFHFYVDSKHFRNWLETRTPTDEINGFLFRLHKNDVFMVLELGRPARGNPEHNRWIKLLYKTKVLWWVFNREDVVVVK